MSISELFSNRSEPESLADTCIQIKGRGFGVKKKSIAGMEFEEAVKETKGKRAAGEGQNHGRHAKDKSYN